MEKRHKLVFVTVGLALLVLGGTAIYRSFQLPNPIEIHTAGHLTVGTGKLDLVLFEDFACVNCHIFTEEVVPLIASQYIDTGKGRLTIIPVSFEPNSKPLANAAIAVYKMVPSRFIPFILGLLDIEIPVKSAILKVAERVGGIDLDRLAYSLDRKMYYDEIDRNLIVAKNAVGPEFGTPMLFVNGFETSTESFDALQRRVMQIESR